jgi:hypothetical protein
VIVARDSAPPSTAIAALALRQHAELGRLLSEATVTELADGVAGAHEEMATLLRSLGALNGAMSEDENVDLRVDLERGK